MEFSPAVRSAFAAATTPEEAAKIFLAAASAGLASVMVKAVDDAINRVSVASASPAITGWQGMIRGAAVCIDWDSPVLLKAAAPVCVSSFASRVAPVESFGVDVSVGISVSARF